MTSIKINSVTEYEFEEMYAVINDAATAYKGVIPDDCYHDPYMSREELQAELNDGVIFTGFHEGNQLLGVMGIQDKGKVNLIRHSYVRTDSQKLGIGGLLLDTLCANATKPILIGTWKDAVWAIRFYEKHAFSLVADTDQKNELLRRFWTIPERQVETSVVLVGNDTPIQELFPL